MTKKKLNKGFLWGLIIGIVVAVAALYYYDQYQRKSKFERDAARFEKNAKKELDKASEKAKKLFE